MVEIMLISRVDLAQGEWTPLSPPPSRKKLKISERPPSHKNGQNPGHREGGGLRERAGGLQWRHTYKYTFQDGTTRTAVNKKETHAKRDVQLVAKLLADEEEGQKLAMRPPAPKTKKRHH